MTVDKKIIDQSLFLVVAGRIDTNTAPELEKELEGLDNIKEIVFDVKDVGYISSAGIRVIMQACKAMNAIKGRVVIKDIKSEVKEVLEMTGVDELVTFAYK
jgi:anti-sigma B factor antagonist